MNMNDDQAQEAIVKHLITHDFVLDIYEQSLEESDPDAKEAIVETARVLSTQIGQYLVTEE